MDTVYIHALERNFSLIINSYKTALPSHLKKLNHLSKILQINSLLRCTFLRNYHI